MALRTEAANYDKLFRKKLPKDKKSHFFVLAASLKLAVFPKMVFLSAGRIEKCPNKGTPVKGRR